MLVQTEANTLPISIHINKTENCRAAATFRDNDYPTAYPHTCIAELCPCIHAAPSWRSQLLRHQWCSWQKGNHGRFIERTTWNSALLLGNMSNLAQLCRNDLLCCLGEDGCEEGLFICPRWGDTGSEPVGPIWGFADWVRVGDQRLTFIRVL